MRDRKRERQSNRESHGIEKERQKVLTFYVETEREKERKNIGKGIIERKH